MTVTKVKKHNDLRFRDPGRNSFSSFDNYGSGSIASSTRTTVNIWNRLSKIDDIWEVGSDLSDDDWEQRKCHRVFCRVLCTCMKDEVSHFCRWLLRTMKIALTTPKILISSLLAFAILSIAGILFLYSFNIAEEESRKEAAKLVAIQTDVWFARVLESAFVPLFTMAQFVNELSEFHSMPFLIGDRCNSTEQDCSNSTAAPILNGKPTHRNLTGIFPENLEERFQDIASHIKERSGLGKALVNIQLAPKAVVSMFYPMVNCEDFEGDVCLNNTGALGHDLLNDPNRVDIARATVPAKYVVTAGPLKLVQGGHPVVEDAFIARLPINLANHSLVVDGIDYSCWGFAVVLLNWAVMKKDSGIYENFEREGMQFKLTRTDTKFNKTSGAKYYKVETIAESENSHLIKDENIKLDLQTGDNNWAIMVGYNDGFSLHYERWGIPLALFCSFVFTLMFMFVLVSNHEHELVLHKMMPKAALKKLTKGETVVERYEMVTIFFSDIVGYTSMTSEMDPIGVMKMLNELYTQFDKLVDKHNVYKVETIGDAYMVLGGAPKKCSGAEAAEKVAIFALDAIEFVKSFKTSAGTQIKIRVGLASGPVVAGVVGVQMPRYCLFGDTVNFASRMESTSKTMRLQVAPITYRLLLDAPKYHFECEERREGNQLGVEVKGKGRQLTWWVNSASKRDGSEKAIEIQEQRRSITIPTKADQTVAEITTDADHTIPEIKTDSLTEFGV